MKRGHGIMKGFCGAIPGCLGALMVAAGIGACSLDIKGTLIGDAGSHDPRIDDRIIEAAGDSGPEDPGDMVPDESGDRVEEPVFDPEPFEVFDTVTDDEVDPVEVDPEGPADADEEEEIPGDCEGVLVGGFCWHVSGVDESCTAACSRFGGCSLDGTRDFAGSGGTDENCVAVLAALGYCAYPHQSYSNNNLGCHFAWTSHTYWSTAEPTTCEAEPFIGPTDPTVYRMCACER